MKPRMICFVLIFQWAQTLIGQQSFVPNISIQQCYEESISYCDIYVGIPANQVTFVKQNQENEVASVEIIILLKKAEQILKAEKYIVESDPGSKQQDFWYFKRLGLPQDSLAVSIEVKDLNNVNNQFYYSKNFTVKNTEEPFLSDVNLCTTISNDNSLPFEKHGFYYEILPFNLCGNEQNTLNYFSELYNIQNAGIGDLAIKSSISTGFHEDGNGEEKIKGFDRLSISSKEIIAKSIDITDLNSGNYHLSLSIVDRNQNEICKKQTNFQVYHPDADLINQAYSNEYFEHSFVQNINEPDLDYALRAVAPQIPSINQSILTNIIENGTIVAKRYFLFNYFTTQSKEYPEVYYNKYMEVADAVDQMYRDNVGFGFETDRGYFFLKYGRPDQKVEVPDEPSSPPYEIWFYNSIESTNQNDVKFLFYNPTLSGNNFFLLHSTCIGERSNPRWEVDLYGDAPNEIQGNRMDANSMSDNNNRNARQYFSDF